MGKNLEIDKLFDEWAEFYRLKGIDTKGFSSDGIIDEARFEKANQRILFVLRETNDFEGGDLRSFLNKTLKWQLWHTVGRWAYGILNDFPDYHECDDRHKIHDAITQVAVINLKKITGRGVSDLDEINETAHRDKEFIRREVDIIDPKVIVACGTRGHLVWLFALDDLPRQDKLALSYSKNGLYLFTRHPARIRGKNQDSYNELKELWNKAKQYGYVE